MNIVEHLLTYELLTYECCWTANEVKQQKGSRGGMNTMEDNLTDDEKTCSRCHGSIVIPKDEHEWEKGSLIISTDLTME